MTRQTLDNETHNSTEQVSLDIAREANIKPFKIRMDKDFHYVLTLGGNDYVRTLSPQKAILVAQELLSTCRIEKYSLRKVAKEGGQYYLSANSEFGKKYPSILHMELMDYPEFNDILKILNKYELRDTRPNNNYLSTRNGNAVSFRMGGLSGLNAVTGEHITEGVVFYNGKIYLPYEKGKFGTISSAASLKLFVQALSVVDWKNGNAMSLLDNRRIVSEMKRLKALAEQGTVGDMDEGIEIEIEAHLFGEESRLRASVLANSIQRLNKMIGVHRFKSDIEQMMTVRKAGRKLSALGIQGSVDSHHTLMLGPAGTGKTEIARLYASILYGLGAIKENKLTELSKEDLVDVFIGGTEEKTQAVMERAMGGVLFVDEAYTLTNSTNKNNHNDYGRIALEIIMRYMENRRGEFVVVFAGYEKEMEQLLSTNEGIQSRIDHRFHFDNYSQEELTDIFFGMVNEAGYELADCRELVTRAIQKDMKNGVLPGNARSVRKIVNQLFNLQKVAIANGEAKEPKLIQEEVVRKLVFKEASRDEEMLKRMQERSLSQLNAMVGLTELKEEIRTWTNLVKVAKKRAELGMETEASSLHMTFKGSPGTGKTTVARIVGELLKSNGLLSRGHFKEVSRADLVGTYQGQTAEKVQKLFEEMSGGVVFIDEAYALVQGENDTFGREAVDVLIAEAENRRDDLVVILAGYPTEIDELFKANPGFISRFPKHFFFPDYSAEELIELVDRQVTGQGLTLTDDAKELIANHIVTCHENGQVDGNGRWVRNVVEKLKRNQANRLAETDDFSDKALRTLTATDAETIK